MTIDTSRLTEVLPHKERLPHTRHSLAIRRAFNAISDGLSWVWLILVAVIVLNVVMRYVFGEGRVEFEEIQWHLYAVGFLLGLSTCMDSDDHVRVDALHERMGLRTRAWIELYGLLLLFFPFVFMVLFFSIPFVQYSFSIAEVSDSPGGLPYRWAIKSVLSVSMVLLLIAGLGRVLRISSFLFGAPVSFGSASIDEAVDVD
jgi:TRAP-type mannitol/chloroaromatic compound transport system permease small subunit